MIQLRVHKRGEARLLNASAPLNVRAVLLLLRHLAERAEKFERS